MSGTPDPPPIARTLGAWIAALPSTRLPEPVAQSCADTLIDTIGLAFAARHSDYIAALRPAWAEPGPCTIFGAGAGHAPGAAAMVNGTAAHGEDFDNTFEGCPVHPGAVIVPAVLAIAEAEGLSGSDCLRGIAVGQELMCRIGLIAQKGIHAAGFHPTAVAGAMGAAAAVAATAGLTPDATAQALGIAGSMASGIIEYLTDGAWTKRMHAGWAAQSGLRAARMGRAGFHGPVSVFEGPHGFFHAFAPSIRPELGLLTRDLGTRWEGARIAFKPFACGTMTQPFIDCALRARAAGIRPEQIEAIQCPVGEGTVHRLWEPLANKRKPPNGYAAKFSTPYCIAVALVHGRAGLAEFEADAVQDPTVQSVAARVSYEIDPTDAYPRNYSGCVRVRLNNGTTAEFRQPHLRGGAREPLSRAELADKCAANLAYGGADDALADRLVAFADGLVASTEAIDLSFLA